MNPPPPVFAFFPSSWPIHKCPSCLTLSLDDIRILCALGCGRFPTKILDLCFYRVIRCFLSVVFKMLIFEIAFTIHKLGKFGLFTYWAQVWSVLSTALSLPTHALTGLVERKTPWNFQFHRESYLNTLLLRRYACRILASCRNLYSSLSSPIHRWVIIQGPMIQDLYLIWNSPEQGICTLFLE